MAQSTDYLPDRTDSRYDAAVFNLWQSSTGESLSDLVSHAKSPNTLRSYESDWRQFQSWAISKGVDVPPVKDGRVDFVGEPLPAELIGLYLADIGGVRAPATVQRQLAAIRHFHHGAGLTSPTDHPGVREALSGYTRKYHREPDRAQPLFLEDLRAGLPDGDGLRALRDRAILLVGFWGALRRSELVAIDLSHVSDHPEGLIVTIPRSKTDQTGEGQRVALHYRDDETVCPVRALRAWLKASGISSGPVFRGINGHVHDTRPQARLVNRVVKSAAERAGLDPDGYSAHSLRSGFVSECDRRGIPSGAVRAVTRHTNDAMLAVYSRPGELFSGSAGAYFDDV